MPNRRILLAVVTLFLTALLLSACGTTRTGNDSERPVVPDTQLQLVQSTDYNYEADDHSPAEHMAGINIVPPEAVAVVNPLSATDESIEWGSTTFAQKCAACHGDSGKGDGPSAVALEPKPANLQASYVQGKTDGGLFWIISHGRQYTAMPPWNNILDEEERWHVVNFLRALPERP